MLKLALMSMVLVAVVWVAKANPQNQISSHIVQETHDDQPLHRVLRAAKAKCRYTKGAWSECVSGMKTRTLLLKKGDSSCEASKPLTKKCGAGSGGGGAGRSGRNGGRNNGGAKKQRGGGGRRRQQQGGDE